jgi:hypothetical protein
MCANHRAYITQDRFLYASEAGFCLVQHRSGFCFSIGMHTGQVDVFLAGYGCFYQLDQPCESFPPCTDTFHGFQATIADFEDGLDIQGGAEETLRAANATSTVMN